MMSDCPSTTGIVDYGVGNLFSLKSSLAAVTDGGNRRVVVSGDADVLASCDRIILPGVGAFGDAADILFKTGLSEVMKQLSESGMPILGICLGMQLLFDKSYEYGEHAGLGLIPGAIRPISTVIPAGLKIPHIGWNRLTFTGGSPILSGIRENYPDNAYVYFVHSYYADTPREYVTSTTDYGAPLTASVQRGNVYGCQFHPEKSGNVGLSILRDFCTLTKTGNGGITL